MNDRRTAQNRALLEIATQGPGTLAADVRAAAASGQGLPDALASYVQKVHGQAYRITDEDIEALKRAGCSEDQIFELTCCAAIGAGFRRLNAGMAALGGGEQR